MTIHYREEDEETVVVVVVVVDALDGSLYLSILATPPHSVLQHFVKFALDWSDLGLSN